MRRALSVCLCSLFVTLFLLPCAITVQGAAPTLISGRVTLDNGKPAAGESVIVRSTDYVSATPSGIAVTDADGRYSVSIDTSLFPSLFAEPQTPNPPPDAHFTVTVRIGSHLYLEPSSRTVTLTYGQTATDTDFMVTTGPQVTVRIHDALTGAPVPDVPIFDNQMGSSSMRPKLGVTDAQGVAVFRLTSLQAELSLFPPNEKPSSVQVAPGYQSYKEIWMKEVQDIVWDVKTYTDPLPPTSLWHGTVLEQDGRPAVGATVHILRRAETVAQTDSRGRFSVSLPPLGRDEVDGMGGLTVAVLAEKGQQTALLVPTPDAVWNGMTLRLTNTPLSSLMGTVVDAQGHPEAGVSVSCWGTPLTAEAVLARKAGNGGVSDAAGRFTISGLPAGRFWLLLSGDSFGSTTIPPQTDLQTWDPKARILLSAGQQNDLGRIVVPAADQTLDGQIVTDAGQPVTDPGRPNSDHNMWLRITGAHTDTSADIDAGGHFHASQLVAEPLIMTISAFFPRGAHGWTIKEIARIPVKAGQHAARVVVPAASLPPYPGVIEKPLAPPGSPK